jgi:hypothetical protein
MAKWLTNTNVLAGWRLVVAVAAGMSLLSADAFAGADEPDRSIATALDIAAALGEDSDEPVEQVAYHQATEPAAGEISVDDDPPPVPAEEIPPSDGGVQGDQRPTRRAFRPITELTIDATLPEGLLPEQVEDEPDDTEPTAAMPEISDPRFFSGWDDQAYLWSATRLCHGPLYFEEVNLERYGYQCHPALQPFVSGAHFFLTVPTLPYQMTVHPPRECIYTLGHYRPGSRVPWQRHRLPCDARAAAVQAGVTVGLIFLIP